MGWLNLTMANKTVKNSLKAKKTTLPQFFILQNFTKFSELIQSYNDVPFLGPEWPICPQQTTVITFSYLLSLLIVQNSSCGSRVMWIGNFSAQNSPFPQMRIFSENLLMSLASFIHAYLHVKYKAQILFYK